MNTTSGVIPKMLFLCLSLIRILLYKSTIREQHPIEKQSVVWPSTSPDLTHLVFVYKGIGKTDYLIFDAPLLFNVTVTCPCPCAR